MIFPEFTREIERRSQTSLAKPLAKFDLEIVLEFYANAWPTQEGVLDQRSRVQGQWIPYDRDSISQFLGDPLILVEGETCDYFVRKNRASGFDDVVIGQLLCSVGHDYIYSTTKRQLRILRTSMTTLTQIWMTFLLSNILPSDHNSDLTIPKCHLVYSFMSQFSVDVTRLISDAIHQFVIAEPPRFPADPTKSNRALGFPALITRLCNFYGLQTTLSRLIRPPINQAFIDKNCLARQEQVPQLPPQHPPTLEAMQPPMHPHQQQPSLDSIIAYMHRMELQQAQLQTYIQHVVAECRQPPRLDAVECQFLSLYTASVKVGSQPLSLAYFRAVPSSCGLAWGQADFSRRGSRSCFRCW